MRGWLSSAPSLARVLERALADTLQALTSRLRAAARPAPTPSRARSPKKATKGPQRRPQAAPQPRPTRPPRRQATPDAPASVVLATLRIAGARDARLVEGTIWRPGTAGPVPHRWVEAGDRVHDPSQGEGRRIWPRELYYLVFPAVDASQRAA